MGSDMGRSRLIKRHIRQRFVVTLKTGETFDGRFEDIDDTHLVLRGAESLSAETSHRIPIPGEVWIERRDIAYMQKLDPA